MTLMHSCSGKAGKVALAVVLLAVLLIPPSLSQEPSEKALEANASIMEAEKLIEEVSEAGFGTTQLDDILLSARQIYRAQLALESQGGQSDFTLVFEMLDRIEALHSRAFDVGDEIYALKSHVEDVRESGMGMEEIDALFAQAEDEFMKERYDSAASLVEDTYDKISEAESKSTTAYVIYTAATQSLTGFLLQNWLYMTIIIVVGASSFFITKNRLTIQRMKRKIFHLENEKDILQSLIRKTQDEYFGKKSLAEDTYEIRIKKFSEMMRDINRQIPLLKEQIENRKSNKPRKAGVSKSLGSRFKFLPLR